MRKIYNIYLVGSLTGLYRTIFFVDVYTENPALKCSQRPSGFMVLSFIVFSQNILFWLAFVEIGVVCSPREPNMIYNRSGMHESVSSV